MPAFCSPIARTAISRAIIVVCSTVMPGYFSSNTVRAWRNPEPGKVFITTFPSFLAAAMTVSQSVWKLLAGAAAAAGAEVGAAAAGAAVGWAGAALGALVGAAGAADEQAAT